MQSNNFVVDDGNVFHASDLIIVSPIRMYFRSIPVSIFVNQGGKGTLFLLYGLRGIFITIFRWVGQIIHQYV